MGFDFSICQVFISAGKRLSLLFSIIICIFRLYSVPQHLFLLFSPTLKSFISVPSHVPSTFVLPFRVSFLTYQFIMFYFFL